MAETDEKPADIQPRDWLNALWLDITFRSDQIPENIKSRYLICAAILCFAFMFVFWHLNPIFGLTFGVIFLWKIWLYLKDRRIIPWSEK